MARDTLFQENGAPEDFRFTERVVEVFDDMLVRSVPCYAMVIEMTADILKRFLKAGDLICDLGSSTGTTLLELSRRLQFPGLRYNGFDNSPAMVEKAALKAEMYSKTNITFHEADITTLAINNAGAVLLNYTLQFIRPMVRQNFLRRVHGFLRPGGVLIVSEKIIHDDPFLNRAFLDFYHDYKRQQGYSEIEITKKREALENVLIPISVAENMKLFKQAGFTHVEPFFKWFNFASFLAVKQNGGQDGLP